MPICRLQKNHALSRRGGLPPLFRLIHPQPLMTQAKQNKERFIHRRSARSLSLVSLSLFLSISISLSLLSTPFSFSYSLSSSFSLFSFTSTGPVSFALFLSSPSHASTRPYGFLHLLALALLHTGLLVTPTRALIASVCLSILPTHPPSHLSLFLSFHGSARSLARSHARK